MTMSKSEVGKLGNLKTQVILKQRRQKIIEEYEKNPKKCLVCGSSISYKDRRNNKFCSHSCSAKFNNLGVKRFFGEPRDLTSCMNCQKLTKNYKFCSKKCYIESNQSIGEISKGDFFKKRKTWQSARSCIRKHAEKIYKNSGKPFKCFCGYDTHIEICHKKSVSDFSDEALIKEINNIENLVSLCPNHHWEFDNGILKL